MFLVSLRAVADELSLLTLPSEVECFMSSLALLRLSVMPPSGPRDDNDRGSVCSGRSPPVQEELGYRIELWDAVQERVEGLLAVTSSPAIAMAAFHAACREWLHRTIALRHHGEILNVRRASTGAGLPH